MARIDITKVGVGAGIGLLDNFLESRDEKAGRTEAFRTWTDLGRLILAGGGYLMQVMNFAPRWGDMLATSATPLLVKSAAKPLFGAVGLSSLTGSRGSRAITRRVVTALNPGVSGGVMMVEQRVPSRRQGI